MVQAVAGRWLGVAPDDHSRGGRARAEAAALASLLRAARAECPAATWGPPRWAPTTRREAVDAPGVKPPSR